MRLAPLYLGLGLSALTALPLQAQFAQLTQCIGQMRFVDDTGHSTYELRLTLSPSQYVLQSTDLDTGEVIIDQGQCSDYTKTGCTHVIKVDGEATGDYYTFKMRPLSGDAYAYEETWADGSKGRTVLSCRPAP